MTDKEFILLQIQNTGKLCETFTKEFEKGINDTSEEWKKFALMWLKEDIELIKAIELLYSQGLTLPCLPLCRTLIEIYFMIEWIFEEGDSTHRIELLKLKSNEYGYKFTKEHSSDAVRRATHEWEMEIEADISKRKQLFLKVYPNLYNNEQELNKKLNAIKSYPKIENKNKEPEYKENEIIHKYLSGAVHAKELAERMSYFSHNNLSKDDSSEVRFRQNLLLMNSLFSVKYQLCLIISKSQMNITPFRDSMLSLEASRKIFIDSYR